MNKTLAIALSCLCLSTTKSFAQNETELGSAPTNQELIEQQTEMSLQRLFGSPDAWGFLNILKGRNQCKYAIQVPDAVTRGTIALTFDDGPNPDTTPKILDVLKAHNAKATFFVLGSKIAGNEALIKRILNEGHQLGNHSYNHPNFHTLSKSNSASQIQSTDRLLRKFTNPIFFRYPFGNSTCSANDMIQSMGYSIVGWDIDTCDWAYADGHVSDRENQTCLASESLRTDYARYVRNEVAKTQGGVLLMHDIHSNTANSLNRLMTMLKSDGYRFVSLDDKNIFPKLNQ